MDLALSRNIQESFYLFQSRVLDVYDRMSEEFSFHVMNAEEPIDVQQRQVRRVVETELSDYFLRYELELAQQEDETPPGALPLQAPAAEMALEERR